MNVMQLLNHINKQLKNGEISMTTEIVYSSDDEGNSYHPIVFKPTPMYCKHHKLPHSMDYNDVIGLAECEDPTGLNKVLCIN